MSRPDELTRQIRRDRESGLSIQTIASKHNTSLARVKRALSSPRYLAALARHRKQLAVSSYSNAVRATQLINNVLASYDTAERPLTAKDLRDLAWVAQSQFGQALSLLKGVLQEHELDADKELTEAAKMIAAKLLREQAGSPAQTIDISQTDQDDDDIEDAEVLDQDHDDPPSA